MNDNNKKDWWEKVGDNMSRRWLSRFETTASRHLGRMPFFVSALDKDKGKQPPTLSLFSTFLLYLSFIISFLSPASMRNHIFPFLSPNAFPPILHCSTTFFHLPQCLSSVFVILFFFFFLVDHHYALSVFSVSADLLPPSSFPLPTVLSVWWGKWEERKRLHPDVKDAKCLGHSHTASLPLCVCMCDWQCNSGELEWGSWSGFVKFSDAHSIVWKQRRSQLLRDATQKL